MSGSDSYRTIPPPLLFLACVAAGGFLQWRWPLHDALYPFHLGMVAGSIMLTFAAILGGWALFEMQRHRTPIHPGRMPRELVTTGPFAHTRNPLYVTLVTIAAAIAVMVGSGWLLLAATLLVGLLDRLVIVREEVAISRRFGDEYASYKSRVRRWV
jgi:protein-S-isoprenylcysteine O-methyltransferase Ste14